MRSAAFGLALVGLVPLGEVRANDQAPLQAVLARAIQAHGGPANLSKFPAATWRGTGRFYWLGNGSVHAVVGARQGGGMGLLAVDNEVNGQRVRLLRVINGSKGWLKLNDRVQDLDAATLAEEQERLYASWMATLVPLVKEQFLLAPVNTIRVQDRPAVGVRLTNPRHRDLVLYFDQETYLLVKKETHVQDMNRQGRDVFQETFYSNHRLVEGIVVPYKMEVRWDGKRYLDMEWMEYQPQVKLPESLFQRP